jgi:hypothetical protein
MAAEPAKHMTMLCTAHDVNEVGRLTLPGCAVQAGDQWHPFRRDEYLPYNEIDVHILEQSALPLPKDIDNVKPLLHLMRDVSDIVVDRFKKCTHEDDALE